MANKEFTLSEWQMLESAKRARLGMAEGELKGLQVKRGEMLVRIADGDDEAGKEIKSVEADIEKLKTEVESLYALLAVIPGRKDFARGVAMEDDAAKMAALEAELPELARRMDAGADALMQAIAEYFVFLKRFNDLGPDAYSLRLQQTYILHSPILHALGFFAKKHGLKFLQSGFPRDPFSFSQWIGDEKPGHMRQAIAGRLRLMRDHAARLKGEDVPGKPNYCLNCHSIRVSYEGDGIKRCAECGEKYAA